MILKLRTAIAAAALAMASLGAWASDADSALAKWKYIPDVHGVSRIYYHLSTENGDSRFEVANARLSAGGALMPWFEYFLQADFCASGSIKPLDAYAIVTPTSGLKLFMGQMRVPFCVDACRAVHEYYFADVATTSTYGNLRGVGFKAGYTIPRTQLYVEGGVFNGADMSSHATWSNAMTYAIKANWKTRCGLLPEVGFMSRKSAPGAVRINQYDVSLSWRHDRLFLEGEYIYRRYAGGGYKASQAYYVLADYAFPLRSRMADKLSVQARYDGITDGTTGIANAKGLLETNVDGFRRATIGVTASRKIGPVYTAFRINYEQYFYGHKATRPSSARPNQIVAGVVFHF